MDNMFRGCSFHTIDDKSRIIVPARFRDVLKGNGFSNSIMVSKMDLCLVAYSLEEWSNIEKRILSMAEKSDMMRRFRRVFLGGAVECTFDKQGRILIPPFLKTYAQLGKDAVLVGVLDHFEIWSRDNWDKENEFLEEDMRKEEVRNEITQLGL